MKEPLKYLLLTAIATLWVAICFILPDFMDNPVQGLRGTVTIGIYIAALAVISFLILYISGLNKYFMAVFYPLYGIAGAGVSYFRTAYHATITPMIIDATLHTNTGTVAGVVSWHLIVWVLANLAIAGLFVWIRWTKIDRQPAARWQALVAFVLLLIYYNGNARLHRSANQRYPMNIVHNVAEYVSLHRSMREERSVPVVQAIAETDSMTIVFVLGEAMRAENLSLNGYPRLTCPRLSQRPNVISLDHIFSEYSYTAMSVPHILTRADSTHTERSYTEYSFIRSFHDAGWHTAWLSNPDYGHTYISFIQEADTAVFPNADKSVFVFEPWYDEELLPHLDRIMARDDAKNLYVLHTIGSHWYYNNHVPATCQRFVPMTDNRVASYNTREQMVNSYDNTALYLDCFLDSVIRRLENRNAVLVYLSDHGEALGENDCWLHAADTPETQNPACIVWYSDLFAGRYPDKVQALKENRTKRYRTDFLYHTLLSAGGLQSEGYSRQADLWANP